MDVDTERHLAAIADEFQHMWPRPGFVRRSEEFSRFPAVRQALNKVAQGEVLNQPDLTRMAFEAAGVSDDDPYLDSLLNTWDSVTRIAEHLSQMDCGQVDLAILRHLSGYTPPRHKGSRHAFPAYD